MNRSEFDEMMKASLVLKETTEKFFEDEDNSYVKRLANARKVIEALDYAKENGLEAEFLSFFIDDLCRGASYDEAIQYAFREWDL